MMIARPLSSAFSPIATTFSDRALTRIFEVVHRDEPDHFLPYQSWLERNGRVQASWNERAADWWPIRTNKWARCLA